jgi:cytochrome c556
VRNAAVTVMEAANLLQMPGRTVARAGEKSEFPDIELAPEEMQKLIDADRKAWSEHANALHDAMKEALRSAEAKDPEGVMAAGELIENACESCHLRYWYPGQVIPPSRTELRGKVR